MQKEAKARIKINTLLENSGWRLFDEIGWSENIQVETNIKVANW